MGVYLDHAATSPMRECAVAAWVEHAAALNPGGQYAAGRAARSVLDDARESIAHLMGAEAIEVVFTASGTEANNLAVRGLYAASEHARILASPGEHPSVARTLEDLTARAGAELDYLPVGSDSRVILSQQAQDQLAAPAALVTCMWANNETGVIHPIAQIVERAVSPVHVDAVQVVGHAPVDFGALGATSLSASAHKFGGPRNVGLLLAKRSPAMVPVLSGGGQERGIRPGTIDVAGAAATAAALREAVAEMETEHARLSTLRDELQAGILARVVDVVTFTSEPALPGHLHLAFPGAEGDSLIMLFDAAGIAASTGSACASGVNRASEVLLNAGVPESTARSAVRFSLGRTTSADDVAQLLGVIEEIVARARLAGMA